MHDQDLLLTNRMVQPLKVMVVVSSIGIFAPLEWNHNTNRPFLTTKKWKYNLWVVKAICVCLNYAFVFLNFLSVLQRNLPTVDRVLATAISAYYFLGFFLEVISIACSDVWSDHAAHTLESYKLVQDVLYKEKIVQRPKIIVIAERAGGLALQVGIIDAAVVWFYSIEFPTTAPISLQSTVNMLFDNGNPPDWFLWEKWILEACLKLWQLYAACNISVIGITLVITLLNDIVLVTAVFSKLREAQHKYFGETQRLVYDTIVILTRELEGIYGTGILSLQLMIMTMAIFGFYGAIRSGELTGLIGGIPALNCYGILWSSYYFWSNYHKQSERALARWKSTQHNASRQTRAALKARRFLRFTVGGCFYIDKAILLTMCKIVFDGTVNALIVTNKSGV